VKIGADELPAVTQLFTEPYMVDFLLHNTIGAWWANRRLILEDNLISETEGDLRQELELEGIQWEFLRFVHSSNGNSKTWEPASGAFNGWPNKSSEIKLLDPCCGSGHFLVAAFLLLVPIRVVEESLSIREAVDAVLMDNIYGLEIDERCCQIAAFNLAFTAWTYPGAGGFRPLPDLNIACTGIGPQSTATEWWKLAEKSGLATETEKNERIKNGLLSLHNIFSQAPTLGSLLNPTRLSTDLFTPDYKMIQPFLETIREAEKADNEIREQAIAAAGMLKAVKLLAKQYTLVITNVPYLGRGKQDNILKEYCSREYPYAKADLSVCFVKRCLEFCSDNGSAALVTPQIWWFIVTYKKFRNQFLGSYQTKSIVSLGEEAWQSFGDRGPVAAMIIVDRKSPNKDHAMAAIDAFQRNSIKDKINELKFGRVRTILQSSQRENPDHRITVDEPISGTLLKEYATAYVGLQNGDVPRYVFRFWELPEIREAWEFFQMAASRTAGWLGRNAIIRWEEGSGSLSQSDSARVQGLEAWGNEGILITRTRKLSATYYSGHPFDQSGAAVIPKGPELLPAIWCFLSSENFESEVRRLDKKVNVTPATLTKIPIDLPYWQREAKKVYPKKLPKPSSSEPTQWLFSGHPKGSDHPLHVAVVRLLGYQWPAELDTNINLASDQREWVTRCNALLSYADEDGIVSIPPVQGEQFAADRLLNLLVCAYGDSWSGDILAQLLKSVDHNGKTLETWLRDKFFVQHCKLFHHRPFIWHIWDGLRDGFAALVNYHKLNAKLLETLIYTYLGDWISRQKQDITKNVDGAYEKLAAAESLQKKLELILEGEAPHDNFIRWKPIEKQPIGWNPDLNDGVRINIRPFMTVGDVKKKGAGVLRDKPNIKWGKDRGKDVASAHWYHLFKGDRINDHHLTLKEKQEARKNKESNIP